MESDYARHSSIFQIISLSTDARDTSTAKVGYVIASSGQSLTDTTLLRPSLSICGRRFYHPPRRPFPSLSLSLHHAALSNPREKENQAFVRTFLGHLSTTSSLSTVPSRSPFVRRPCRSIGNLPCSVYPFEGKRRSQWSVLHERETPTRDDGVIEERARFTPRESDISAWFRWIIGIYVGCGVVFIGWGEIRGLLDDWIHSGQRYFWSLLFVRYKYRLLEGYAILEGLRWLCYVAIFVD